MIRFENVTKTYKGSTVALRDVSLEVDKGEFVFLVGASGSGKTTFIRLLLREELPDQGRIWEAGRDIVHLPKWRVPYLRRNIGCVFQDFRLLPNKSVFDVSETWRQVARNADCRRLCGQAWRRPLPRRNCVCGHGCARRRRR